MWFLLSWILFGLVVGIVMQLLLPRQDSSSFLVTILIGVCGAIAGWWIGGLAGWAGPAQGAGFLIALLGATALLVIHRVVFGARDTA